MTGACLWQLTLVRSGGFHGDCDGGWDLIFRGKGAGWCFSCLARVGSLLWGLQTLVQPLATLSLVFSPAEWGYDVQGHNPASETTGFSDSRKVTQWLYHTVCATPSGALSAVKHTHSHAAGRRGARTASRQFMKGLATGRAGVGHVLLLDESEIAILILLLG